MSATHRSPPSSRKRNRRPFEHHSGNYRNVDPAQPNALSKPWEWTPVTTYELPMSPIKPVFSVSNEQNPFSPLSELSRSNHARSPVQLHLNTNPNLTAIVSGSSSLSSPTSSMGKSVLGSPGMGSGAGVVVVKLPQGKKDGFWKRLVRFLTTGSSSRSDELVLGPINPPSPPDSVKEDKVQPHEWKQYGYWARPHLNNVFVDNEASSPKPISTPALQTLLNSLRTEHIAHPENWVPGTTHPSLPPKPTRWKTPKPGAPLPFPWEVQLNPLLKHHLWGESPLKWYISRDPDDVEYALAHGGNHIDTPCQPSDLAQPATYPFLTHMHMNAVAGDTAPCFPWPFTITNPKGIKVGDVLSGIFKAFTTPVTTDEINSWPIGRQRAADHAWRSRVQALDGDYRQWGMQVPAELTRILRCDAMGGVMWFRGIEPSVNGGGWMITLGTH
ncbi:hypothetical protein CVT24_008684 [Panaeolus cyanescens]|uniref:DUF6699 domain-containing protein n=1 Tax=Panaeolus cyanescens TaxID=181874 RepID=A0A409VKN2_9AGAR|nr:hypothetical protein CVT24_008684 [Panaeolus cyanescens]